MALTQWWARAASTATVFFGQGPSSNVRTTSPSRRKSCVLKCSNPKPGPPVVSISTVRETPRAFGLPGHLDDALAGGGGGAAAGADAGWLLGAALGAGACCAWAITMPQTAIALAKASLFTVMDRRLTSLRM